MKTRNGFVSNSSSSSFIIRAYNPNDYNTHMDQDWIMNVLLDPNIKIKIFKKEIITEKDIAEYLLTGKGLGWQGDDDNDDNSDDFKLRLINKDEILKKIIEIISVEKILKIYNIKIVKKNKDDDSELIKFKFLIDYLGSQLNPNKELIDIFNIFYKVYNTLSDFNHIYNLDILSNKSEQYIKNLKYLKNENKKSLDDTISLLIKFNFLDDSDVIRANIDNENNKFDDNIYILYGFQWFFVNLFQEYFYHIFDNLYKYVLESVLQGSDFYGYEFGAEGAGNGFYSYPSEILYEKKGLTFLLNTRQFFQEKKSLYATITSILDDLINNEYKIQIKKANGIKLNEMTKDHKEKIYLDLLNVNDNFKQYMKTIRSKNESK